MKLWLATNLNTNLSTFIIALITFPHSSRAYAEKLENCEVAMLQFKTKQLLLRCYDDDDDHDIAYF